MDAENLFVVNASGIGHAMHLLEKVLPGVLGGGICREVERHVEPKVGNHLQEPRLQVVHGAIDGALDLLLEVSPDGVDESGGILLHELAVRVAHLVRGAVQVHEVDGVVATANTEQLGILHAAHGHGRRRVDGVVVLLGVGIRLTAQMRKGGRGGKEEEEEEEARLREGF